MFAFAFLVYTKLKHVKEEISMDARKLDYRNILGDPMTRAEVLGKLQRIRRLMRNFKNLQRNCKKK